MSLVLFQIHVETVAFNINHKTYTYKYIQRMKILNPFLDHGIPHPVCLIRQWTYMTDQN